ncbi:MAG: hypothetical protein WC794_05600, partial [Candidatus Doudnabacteria bacterium]
TFASITAPTSGQVVTIWLDTNTAGGDKGTLAFVYGSSCTGNPNCTGLKIVKNQVRLDTYNGSPITTTDLVGCDNDSGANCTDTDIGFTANSGALILTRSADTLAVATGGTFVPDGNITAPNITIDGTLTAAAASTIYVGNTWTNNGIFNPSTGTVSADFTTYRDLFITGSSTNTFYNFTATGANTSISFKSNTTTTFTNLLTVAGQLGSPIIIKSDTAGQLWLGKLTGTASLTSVAVLDSGCGSGTNNFNLDGASADLGNNSSCWVFGTLVHYYGGGGGNVLGGDGGGTPVGGGGAGGGDTNSPITISGTAFGSGASISASVSTGATLNIATGDLIVAVVTSGGSASTIQGVTDGTNSLIYVPGSRATDAGGAVIEMWYLENATAKNSATFTATLSATSFVRSISVWQIAGAATSGALDQVNTQSTTDNVNQTVQNVTTTQPDEIIIAGFMEFMLHNTFTVGSGFTKRGSFSYSVGLERIVSTTGTYPSGTMVTVDSTSNNNYLGSIATFKANYTSQGGGGQGGGGDAAP